MVSDPRYKMSHFLTCVSDDFKEDCHSAILHGNQNISRLMVNAKHVKEARSRRNSNDAKYVRSFNGVFLIE